MTLQKHLFIGVEGDLRDLRKPNWASDKPLRERFQWHFSRIDSLAKLKATLRAGDCTWPGCYQLYLLTNDGQSLCFGCARKEWRQLVWDYLNDCDTGWKVVGCDINHEDTEMTCCHCNKEIPASLA